MLRKNKKNGFAMLYASLVGALVLAIGLAILNVTIKQITLASAGRESQLAFYAADSGIECAQYLDKGGNIEACRESEDGDGAFSKMVSGIQSGVCNGGVFQCVGQNVTISVGNVETESIIENGDEVEISFIPNTFSVTAGNTCFDVVVKKVFEKESNPFNKTIIESTGYNNCNSSGTRYARTLQSK